MTMKSSQIASLVQQLRDASAAYYNGGTPLMDDETFDAAVDRLRELDATNPFLSEVGSAPTDGTAVTLPVPMPSLDKIKPGEDRLTKFLSTRDHSFVVSEKLDGLSALWIPAKKKLYLRGDGLKGQDVSHLVDLGLQGLRPPAEGEGGEMVRGELILPRSAGESLARSWVNGIVHRSLPTRTDVSRIRFVAYELVKPSGVSRSQQFIWLTSDGYEVPWHTTVAHLDQTTLAKWLQDRRATSLYDTDGLVVGLDAAPKSESTATKVRNPKDCVAFKMPLAEQSAETTVRAIEWGISAQGYMIPTLRFDPVVIGSATIQCCTGHNAKTVLEGQIGPGARVVIRRSGDVIPKLDRVVTGAGEVPFPPEGTYEWDATHTHIRITSGGVGSGGAAGTAAPPKELLVARLGHFLKTLDIPGSGPATAAALVEAGYSGPAKLWAASPEQLSACLGPKTGASLHTNLREALRRTDEKALMIASSQMPRGVGDTKLSALYTVSADPSEWSSALKAKDPPSGWTTASLETFWSALTTYIAWRKQELSWIPFPLKGAAVATATAKAQVGVLCFSGFRDKELEAAALAGGWMIAPTFTGKVTHLLIPDGALKESEKTKSAQAKGIPILSRSVFMAQYLTKTG